MAQEVLDRIASVVDRKRTELKISALKKYRQFVELIARGDALDDKQAEQLGKIIDDLGLSKEELKEDMEAATRIAANASFYASFEEDMAKLNDEISTHGNLVDELHKQHVKAKSAWEAAKHRLQINIGIKSTLDELQGRHPRVFAPLEEAVSRLHYVAPDPNYPPMVFLEAHAR